MNRFFPIFLLLLCLTACKSNTPATVAEDEPQLVGPTFDADSAMAYCAAQCDFGPRTMNSEAHEKCGEWIIKKFKELGCDVKTQKADLKAWDGTTLHSTNIIASINAEARERLIICAHWDSRPWADNDPDSTNWHTPVVAANDGASGVAVMLELARIINISDTIGGDTLSTLPGIDFVCFDAEDYGVPQWSNGSDDNSWALGAQHFAQHLGGLKIGSSAEPVTWMGAILLDMVGGQNARFYQEGFSMHYAADLVSAVWQAARQAGYASYFPQEAGGAITDDHKPLNEAGLPAIDIIPYYPDCEQSSFGPTWHTINDDMKHIDKNALKAVGQTLIQYLYR